MQTTTSRKARQQKSVVPSASSSKTAEDDFEIPSNAHLLITTPKHIYTWDREGLHVVFTSTKNGIVAAKEANNGSGVMAVASQHVVVMHDPRRNREDSWGLNANDGGIRHLDFANDGLSLYYSLHHDNSIQHYSVDRTRLLEPVRTNPQPPTAMAISPTGHLMISATESPPVVLMRNLEHNSAAVMVKTPASNAAVSSITFHPKRPDILVLAFFDGTLAAYDGTKITKAAAGSAYGDSQSKGEIGRVVGVYTAVASSTNAQGKVSPAAPIVGVAFLPSHKTRVVTAGADGRCRLVDFAQGGSILRTWHTKMPITSLSVFDTRSDATSAPSETASSTQERKSSRTGSLNAAPSAGNTLIAVSRIDGSVQIYNTLGLLLSRKSVTSYDERILSIAWMKGASPASLDNSNIEKRFSEAPKDPNGDLGPAVIVQHAVEDDQQIAEEADEGTTRIRSPPATTMPTLAPLKHADFQDLFSPIKPQSPPRVVIARVTKGSSPKRHRPGLSNQTFVQSLPPDAETQTNVAPPRNLALSPSSDSDIYITAPSQQQQSDVSDQMKMSSALQHTGSLGLPLLARKRQVVFKATTPRRQVSGFSNSAVPPPNTNAKVLADLRKLAAANSSASRQTGTLSSFAPAQQRPKPSHQPNADRSGAAHLKSTNPSSAKKRRSAHLHDSTTWPTDSVSAPSIDEEKVEDIWLTSEAEESHPPPPRRRGQRRKRISQSSTLFPQDFDSGIGYSESRTIPQSASTHQDHANLRFTDLTFSDHGESHDYINEVRPVESTTPLLGTEAQGEDQQPISDAVRRLFPRSSSRSPRRLRQDNTTLTHLVPLAISDDSTPQSPRAPRSRRKGGATATLMSLAVQSAEQQQQKTKKVYKQVKTSQPPSRPRAPQENDHRGATNNDTHDTAPVPTNPSTTTSDTRVASLENEVLTLKAEVLALKALLRRHGIPASQVQAASALSVEKAKKASGWTACLRG